MKVILTTFVKLSANLIKLGLGLQDESLNMSEKLDCYWCASACKKDGKQKNGVQKFRCKNCGKYQQENYTYNARKREVHHLFRKLRKFGVSHNAMAEFLGISLNTLQHWILKARRLRRFGIFDEGGVFDVDELRTFCGSKKHPVWVAYGWNKRTKTAVGLHVGRRTKVGLKNVVDAVLITSPKWINTDYWKSYPPIIPTNLHKPGRRKTNHIERNHVELRKNIGYLGRKSICFTRKLEFLEARLCWYFWGDSDPYFFLRKA